ncbi:TetR/AcrR family transcriptional regulator [Microbacterium sp. SS28]|uniref:TetR/AcrR family transcriptional regulator n=1 Tax=Microbacterium sp. SS28 TaxID=2919948 RepID=UPI001FA9D481|nr:TetR/AcrR family transcriptional regulator [Microbacterium sp. SS28]
MPTPDRTSFTAIVDAGRDLLEDGGVAALTMQGVAERVGVRAPSLYKRVRDRDALIAAVASATVDDLADRLEASDGSLEDLARAYRAFAHARPEGFRLMFATAAPQEALDRAAAAILGTAAALAGEGHGLEAARLVTAWATGFLHMELAGAFRLGGDIDDAFEFGLAALRRGLVPA